MKGDAHMARRSYASTGNIAGLVTVITTAVATRPTWLANLESDTWVFTILNSVWMICVSAVAATWILGVSLRSAAVEGAQELGKPPETG